MRSSTSLPALPQEVKPKTEVRFGGAYGSTVKLQAFFQPPNRGLARSPAEKAEPGAGAKPG